MSLKYAEELDKLGIEKSDYVIVGQAALVLHGLKARNDSIVLVVSEDAKTKLVSNGSLFCDETGNICVLRHPDGNIVVVNEEDIDVKYYFDSCIFIDGYPCLPKVPLRHYLQYEYKKTNDNKLKKDIDLLR